MGESMVWLRVHFISYAVAWGIFYSYALLLTDSGRETTLAVCGLVLLAVSVFLYVWRIRRALFFIGILFAALVLVSMTLGEYVLAVLHVGAFLPLVGWIYYSRKLGQDAL